jgi:hypothetical protein
MDFLQDLIAPGIRLFDAIPFRDRLWRLETIFAAGWPGKWYTLEHFDPGNIRLDATDLSALDGHDTILACRKASRVTDRQKHSGQQSHSQAVRCSSNTQIQHIISFFDEVADK